MSDTYLFDVGWLFLTAWGAIVVAVSVAAFGRDLLGPTSPDQARARQFAKSLGWTSTTHPR